MRAVFHRLGPVLAVALLAGLMLWTRMAQIDASLPYPRQVDEAFLTARASRILAQNDFNPGWFRYPSLPIYLTSAAMALGFVRSAQLGQMTTPDEIGSVGLPYYTYPAVMAPARHLFAFTSVLAVVVYALIAARLLRQPWVAPLVVAALGTSALYFELSWTYLNVDILGAATTAVAVALSLNLLEATGGARRGFMPGLVAGLAASCKYNCGLVLAATLIALLLGGERQRRFGAMWVALAGAATGFLLGSPYALLNLSQFLADVGYEAHHYATGHPGFSADPGWPQLRGYTGDLVRSFGFATLPVAAIGVLALLFVNFRGACVLLAFPALLLTFLCRFRVQFARNALALHGLYAVLVAIGTWTIAHWLTEFALRCWAMRRRPLASPARPALIFSITFGTCALAFDLRTLSDQFKVRGDSRVHVAAWVGAHLPPASVILIPAELGVDARAFAGVTLAQLRMLSFNNPAEFQAALSKTRATHVLWPEWGRDARFGGKAELERVRSLTVSGQPEARFGEKPVLVNYPGSNVPWGDPAFTVLRLNP